MRDEIDVRAIAKTGLILFLITGIAALILAVVNNVTKPIISENEIQKQELAMKKVMPEAEAFKEIDKKYEENDKVSQIYAAEKDGDVIGYAVIAEPNGYGGAISMVVGVSKDGFVTGVDITSQSETAGLGANCTKDEFKNQFIGKSEGITVVKNNAEGNKIDAMTSATITSKAVTDGVNMAIDAVKEIEGRNE